MSKILFGTPVAQEILKKIRTKVQVLPTAPQLRIMQVGQHQPSTIYIKHKVRAARSAGVGVSVTVLPESVTTEEVLGLIHEWNSDPQVSAVLVQMPLPPQLDKTAVVSAIEPTKDADGLHPYNLGLLLADAPQIIPATAKGVMKLLQYYNIDILGCQAVVIGRSQLVGKPAALLLSKAGATVTVAHRQTTDLARVAKAADIIISAAGQPNLIQPRWLKPETVVIDVGITRIGAKLHGDAGLVYQADSIKAISPVPGGVGPLTIACLLENVLICHSLQT